MIERIHAYLSAEKQESLLFIAVGVAAILIAAWLWMNGHRLKAMAFPLIGVALIQLVVGGTVYLRSDKQAADLAAQAASQPAEFNAAETARMAAVMKNFTLYKWIEIGLLAAGVLLIVLLPSQAIAAGIGAGLVLQSGIMLCLDVFAEERGQAYLDALGAFAR